MTFFYLHNNQVRSELFSNIIKDCIQLISILWFELEIQFHINWLRASFHNSLCFCTTTSINKFEKNQISNLSFKVFRRESLVLKIAFKWGMKLILRNLLIVKNTRNSFMFSFYKTKTKSCDKILFCYSFLSNFKKRGSLVEQT